MDTHKKKHRMLDVIQNCYFLHVPHFEHNYTKITTYYAINEGGWGGYRDREQKKKTINIEI